jgi:hypothetical protein
MQVILNEQEYKEYLAVKEAAIKPLNIRKANELIEAAKVQTTNHGYDTTGRLTLQRAVELVAIHFTGKGVVS